MNSFFSGFIKKLLLNLRAEKKIILLAMKCMCQICYVAFYNSKLLVSSLRRI